MVTFCQWQLGGTPEPRLDLFSEVGVSQWSWSSPSSQSRLCLNDHGHQHRHNHGCVSIIIVIIVTITVVSQWSWSSTSSSGRRGFHQQHQRTIQNWWDAFEEKKHGLPCVSYLENNSKITTAGYNGNGLWELRAPSLSARVGLTGSNQDIC